MTAGKSCFLYNFKCIIDTNNLEPEMVIFDFQIVILDLLI